MDSPENPEQGLTVEEIQGIIASEMNAAVQFIEMDIGPDRAESTKYYRGDPLGNEEEGRSQIVTRDVRDAVRQVLPSLIEVFLGSERATEFVPKMPEDVQEAEWATDYILHIITNENPGVEIFYSWFKDSLYNKVGIVKWWKDDSKKVTYHNFSGLDDVALGLILQEKDVELVNVTSTPVAAMAGIAMMHGMQPPMTHDGTVRRTTKGKDFKFACVPPEEFLIDRNARSIEDASYVGHRTLKSYTDLVALGLDPQLVEDNVNGGRASLTTSTEVTERYRDQGGQYPYLSQNPGEQKALYTESYVRMDVDGDGISELRKFCTLGEGQDVVNGNGFGEPVDERPFAALCPDPEPHLFFGNDLADMTKDLQRIGTNVLRAVLDSLSLTIYPRAGVVEGQVNMEDALNTEMGALVRMNAPGMYQPFATEFVGAAALPILDLLKSERDSRIGIHNMSLDADALQSTTKSAVDAQTRAATQNIRMIARMYAETGVKQLMKGLLRLVVAHQDKPLTIRLRNQWVQIDPCSWNADMDLSVNVGLGYGMTEDRVAVLQEIKTTQEAIIQQYGPSNPLVGLDQYRNALAKLMELGGFKDASSYFKAVPPGWQPPPQQPKPSPEELLANVEMQKIKADMAVDSARLDLDRDKALADILLRADEINVKYGTQVNVAQIRQTIQTDQLARADASTN